MKKRPIFNIIISIFITIAFLAYYSAIWCFDKYGDVGFDAILFTLFSDLNGVEGGLVSNYLMTVSKGLLYSLPLTLFILLFNSKNAIVLTFKKLKLTLYPLGKIQISILSFILCFCLVFTASKTVGADVWLESVTNSTKIYNTEYINPKTASITFPKNKRNLIYILIESGETTFYSKDEGGAFDKNHIPELYDLAQSNISFSQNTNVPGINVISGASWTMGAIVAQTAGIPLNLPVGGNEMSNYSSFLPGAYTLNDILHENGYYQSFLCGSNAEFGGRKKYFEQHNVDEIFDYISAPGDNIIPEGYHDNWWGMEDFKLYEYAKQRLLIDSQKEEPFALFMLTVDTHHIGGKICEYCEESDQEQYLNVYNCASKQINNFVNWIKEQDFYDNTTIVIAGDHLSMDYGFMERNIDVQNYGRKIYNCFINSAVTTNNNNNRVATQLDMLPTVLAAMGCKIQNNKLALGVNLFSKEPTLVEKYGFDNFNLEISKKSNFYDNVLLRPIK